MVDVGIDIRLLLLSAYCERAHPTCCFWDQSELPL